jgi:hypothetical protein
LCGKFSLIIGAL